MKKIIIGILCLASLMTTSQAQINTNVKKVYVIFKTHFDLGYTDLSSTIEKRYLNNFIPQAISLAETLRKENSKARYVWTTGSWLIDSYLKEASESEKHKLEEAIVRGDIVWNAAPYTIQSESSSKDLFTGMLLLSKQLDEKYGKKTIAAKMTDVPGHTRSIITPLYDAGIKLLNVGVNNCSTVPVVPLLSRWRNIDGKEIILMYQTDYGGDMITPDNENIISINLTPDNHGPHTIEQVKTIFKSLEEKYPNAEFITTSLSEVAKLLINIKNQLPIVTSEIGDTWIFGYASSPHALARYRELMRLYSVWLKNGKLEKGSDIAISFAIRLGLFAEHTWGLDHLVHIKNWDKYDVDAFNMNRDLPEFRRAEQSWKEKAKRIDEAIAVLPYELKNEAIAALSLIDRVSMIDIKDKKEVNQLNKDGSILFSYNGVECNFGTIAYQTYSSDDYDQYVVDYIRDYCGQYVYYYTKTGLEQSKAQSTTVEARKIKAKSQDILGNDRINCTLKFPIDPRIDSRVFPEQIHSQYTFSSDKKSIELEISLVNKPAVRLPEAYWVSFFPSNVVSILVDKMGMPVNVQDVVKGGNRQMHGINNYVDIITDEGTLRITSLDAGVVAIGERRAMNYSLHYPDINTGVHFCLVNNLWTTNFNAWWGGSIKYRFKIEYLNS